MSIWSIMANVMAIVLLLGSVAGVAAAFLLDTAIMPWAVAILVSYSLHRVETTNKKVTRLLELFDETD